MVQGACRATERIGERSLSKKEDTKSIRKTSIGGQALMEGIMMRGPEKTAMAVRTPNGDIVLEDWENHVAKRPRIAKVPIIRGVIGFVDSMISGYRCLMRSAEITALEDVLEPDETKEEEDGKHVTLIVGNGPVPGYMLSELKEKEEKAAQKEKTSADPQTASGQTESDAEVTASSPDAESGKPAPEGGATGDKTGEKDKNKKDGKEDDKLSKGTWNAMMGVSIVLALALCVTFFVILPSFLYILFSGLMLKANPENVLFLPDVANVGKWSWRAVAGIFGTEYATIDPTVLSAGTLALRSLIRSAFEGVLKILLLVGYMAAISLMKDIRRTFMYHGAEHKTIFCYEKGLDLTVENVRLQRRFHPRCGTSFLILMLLVSVFVTFFIDPLCVLIFGNVPALAIRIIVKICLIPLIMGLGYELLKFAGRHDNLLTKIISAPGVALQHITVFEPTDDMIECAIAAVKKVIPADGSDKW